MQQATVIAANRFGLGARPGDFGRIDRNPPHWLLDQLQGPTRTPADLLDLPHSSAVLVEVENIRREQRARRRAADTRSASTDMRSFGSTVRGHHLDQVNARYRAASESDQPFHERLVHFWANHFAVSGEKRLVSAVAGLFENEAIRPHVAGKFADLLIAAEQHPAMILYLDNQRSVGPSSTLARRLAQRRPNAKLGLNENLAREILELHTLGVAGGYTQEDVTTFAKIITGWSIGNDTERGRFAGGAPGRFTFRESIHEPGSQVVLGKRYAQPGVQQGIAVLRDLAARPETARFIATKLVRHFVADDPPARLVEALSGTFLETGGDLAAVYEALVTASESWSALQSKYKTPSDFLISTFRALDHSPQDARAVVAALDLMGQPPYRPGSPEGWPDTAVQWGGADGLYKRIEWSSSVAQLAGGRARPLELGEAVLGLALSTRTRDGIAQAEGTVQGMTLLLASPEFQRR